MSTSDLLEQWREATRAAELADRLVQLAQASAERSDNDALAAEEIAKMAEDTAEHAERAGRGKRQTAPLRSRARTAEVGSPRRARW